MTSLLRRVFRRLARGVAKRHSAQQETLHCQPGRAFDVPHYQEITAARLEHLRAMGLPISGKSVIDVGCGIGRLSEYFAEQGCDVLCVDGRKENIEKLRELYPDRRAAVADLETEAILQHGQFDVVFCYGLLYHVVDVFGLLKRLARMCGEMLLIETCVAPVRSNALFLFPESQSDVTQALHGLGSRPSPEYVCTCLRLAGFEFVYSPQDLPLHSQFCRTLVDDITKWEPEKLSREIFIASRSEIVNTQLVRRQTL